jgi:hypothetical protein
VQIHITAISIFVKRITLEHCFYAMFAQHVKDLHTKVAKVPHIEAAHNAVQSWINKEHARLGALFDYWDSECGCTTFVGGAAGPSSVMACGGARRAWGNQKADVTYLFCCLGV